MANGRTEREQELYDELLEHVEANHPPYRLHPDNQQAVTDAMRRMGQRISPFAAVIRSENDAVQVDLGAKPSKLTTAKTGLVKFLPVTVIMGVLGFVLIARWLGLGRRLG